MFIDFREEGKGGREGEKHWCEREALIGCLLYVPLQGLKHNLGMYPDQGLNLTGNWTCDLLLHRMMLQPSEAHLPGLIFFKY